MIIIIPGIIGAILLLNLIIGCIKDAISESLHKLAPKHSNKYVTNPITKRLHPVYTYNKDHISDHLVGYGGRKYR